MAQGGMSWICLAIAVLLTLAPGCSSYKQTKSGFVGNLARSGNLLSLYPVGPVNQNFTCFGIEHEDADRLVGACFRTGEHDQLRDKNFPPTFGIDDVTRLVPKPPTTCTCDSSEPTCENSCVDTAIGCAAATRNSYADFLNCREDFQIGVGTAITTVAAASAAVTLGASAVAGAALGSVAAAGLGADYIGYNSMKSAAYATATSQLQCIIYDASSLTGTLPSIETNNDDLNSAFKSSAASPECAPKPYLPFYLDVQAERGIALQQIRFLQKKYQRVGLDIFATTQNIDVRAFSGGQSGVPSATTIQSALQAENSIVGVVPSAGGQKNSGAQPNNFVVLPTPPQCTKRQRDAAKEALEKAQTSADNIRTILRQIILPQQGFPDCMALSTSAPSASASSATGSSSGGSATGAANAAGAIPAGGGVQNPMPAQKPVNVPFQILPVSSAGGQGAGGQGTPQPAAAPDLRTDLVSISVKSTDGSGSVVIKVIGGTPPYYATIVEGNATIVHETETDPFVSYQVLLPQLPEMKRDKKDKKTTAPKRDVTKEIPRTRLLFADQGGSQQFVTLQPTDQQRNPPTDQPTSQDQSGKTPAACCPVCCKPAAATGKADHK